MTRMICTGQSANEDLCEQLMVDVCTDQQMPFDLEHTLGQVPLLVMATECDEKGEVATHIRNYDEQMQEERWRARDAIRATTSFPTVTPKFQHPVNRKFYRDGGLFANNPTLEALCEVRRLWPN